MSQKDGKTVDNKRELDINRTLLIFAGVITGLVIMVLDTEFNLWWVYRVILGATIAYLVVSVVKFTNKFLKN